MIDHCQRCGAPRPEGAVRCGYCATVFPASAPEPTQSRTTIASTNFAGGSLGRFLPSKRTEPDRAVLHVDPTTASAHVQMTKLLIWLVLWLTETHDDTELAVRVRFDAPPNDPLLASQPSSIALGLRGKDSDSYRLYLFSTGSLTLKRMHAQGSEVLLQSYRHRDFKAGEMNELRLSVTGDRLRAHLNGTLVGSTRDEHCKAGNATFWAAGAGDSSSLRITDLKLFGA
jgi:hypothetical protein